MTHGMGPVFRFGRNPALCLFLSRKIADVGIRALTCSYCHEPSTALGHFGTKFGLLSHCRPIGASAGLAKHGLAHSEEVWDGRRSCRPRDRWKTRPGGTMRLSTKRSTIFVKTEART
jgi:hypothetical protein